MQGNNSEFIIDEWFSMIFNTITVKYNIDILVGYYNIVL